VVSQKIAPGLSSANVKFIPDEWSAQWFRHFITSWLQNSDTRNAIPGAGISITGGVNTPATISASLLVGPAFSIVGNPTNETGGDTNIAATARGQVLNYNGGTILFSTLELADNSGLGPSFSVGPGVTSGQVLQVGSDTADAAFSQIVFPTAVAPGDLIIGTAVANVIGGLPIGTSAQVLLVDTGLPVWHNQADLFAAVPAAISQGGTNATTAPAALNNLLPVQVAGEWLTTDGTTPSWASLPAPPVESIGWGTPVNAAVQNNFDGAAATLAQTSAALAELIMNLKAFGLLGA
jgi:hypothetical protein